MDYGTTARLIGKGEFRVRESLVSEVYAELAGRRPNAVKLDLVLRGIGLYEHDLGKRKGPAGVIPMRRLRLWHLAELIQPVETDVLYAGQELDDDLQAPQIATMREHVRRTLELLEQRKLVRRESRPGRTPQLYVLSDLRDEEPFDDPDGGETGRYISVPGVVIASRILAGFDGPRLVGFLAALIGEAHGGPSTAPKGDGSWFRTPAWFLTRYGRDGTITFPFKESTLKKGLRLLVQDGLISVEKTRRHPRTGVRMGSTRNVYTNHFATVGESRLTLASSDYAPSQQGLHEPGRRDHL
jgi:hypothetical protein